MRFYRSTHGTISPGVLMSTSMWWTKGSWPRQDNWVYYEYEMQMWENLQKQLKSEESPDQDEVFWGTGSVTMHRFHTQWDTGGAWPRRAWSLQVARQKSLELVPVQWPQAGKTSVWQQFSEDADKVQRRVMWISGCRRWKQSSWLWKALPYTERASSSSCPCHGDTS